jgi:hypothetical protein
LAIEKAKVEEAERKAHEERERLIQEALVKKHLEMEAERERQRI